MNMTGPITDPKDLDKAYAEAIKVVDNGGVAVVVGGQFEG